MLKQTTIAIPALARPTPIRDIPTAYTLSLIIREEKGVLFHMTTNLNWNRYRNTITYSPVGISSIAFISPRTRRIQGPIRGSSAPAPELDIRKSVAK